MKPDRNGPPATALEQRRPLGPINRYTLLIPLCILGIVIANIYSLLITNNGLLLSKVFPELRILDFQIPQEYATFVFASVLQFGILALYLLFAIGRFTQKVLVTPFLITLVVVSFYFGFLSVHAHSRGDAYVGSLPKRIDNLVAGIQGENQLITTSVNQALEGNLRLAEDSQRGQDKTRVARCGSLCRGYYDRAEAIRGQYGHLLTVPETPPASTDLREQWRAASTLFSLYVGRAQDYQQFLKGQGNGQRYTPKPALVEAHDTLQQAFGKGMDDRWMLTARSLWDITQDVGVGLSALISIMPDIINISLALTISTLLSLSRRGTTRRRVTPQDMPPSPVERQEPVIGNLPTLVTPPPTTPTGAGEPIRLRRSNGLGG